jgi:hypothetical protein
MFNPDYTCGGDSPFHCWNHQLLGIVTHLDTSSLILGRIGFEAEARFMLWHNPTDMVQTSYMGGPRVRIFRHKNLLFTGKFVLGYANLDIAPLLGHGGYFAYAPGAAIDYRVARYWAVRIDYEHQRWPNFPCWHSCGSSGTVGGLTPNGFTYGV